MKPMLLQEYRYNKSIVRESERVFIQPKLNGWRCRVNTRTGELCRRSGGEWGKPIDLPHISREILLMSGLPEYMDGELYDGGTDKSVASSIAHKSEKVKLYIFDAITEGPFSARMDYVSRVTETEHIRTVATACICPSRIMDYYREYLRMGLEGAVIRLDREYVYGRTNVALKLKPCCES